MYKRQIKTDQQQAATQPKPAQQAPSIQQTSAVRQPAWTAALDARPAAGLFGPVADIQAKLTVNQPGDPYEQEADQVADRVMRMPAPQIQRTCACGGEAGPDGECEACKAQRLALQRRADIALMPTIAPPNVHNEPYSLSQPPAMSIQRLTGHTSGQAGTAPASVDHALANPGMPLQAGVQNEMGRRFGYDFSRVRIHTDAAGEQSARDVNAYAYTVGHNIVFGAGRFAPGTYAGQHLLAHELTHVVQQGHGLATPKVQRNRCGHDGQGTKCGASNGVWKLIDQITNEANLFSVDDLVVEGGLKNFGGDWARQVQSPPNLVKNEKASRGRIDGVKVKVGSTLDIQVVEIKARSPDGGGCTRATLEANGYINELKTLIPLIIPLSARLATNGGLRVASDRCKAPKMAERSLLEAAGVDFNNPSSVNAWCFYNSLQERLGIIFTTAFTAVTIGPNTDGSPNQSYDVLPPVVINCRKTKKNPAGLGLRYLQFQVNQKGGVSYGCRDVCQSQDDDEKEKKQTQDVEARDRVRVMDEQFQNIDTYNRLEFPSDKAPQPGVSTQPQDTQTSDQDTDEGNPVQLPPEGVSELDALKATAAVVSTVAVLHLAIKYAPTAAEKVLARRLIEKTIVEGTEKGALAIAKKLDSANLIKYGTKEGEVLLKGADDAMILAARNSPRLAARLGPKALKGLAKAGPIIGLILAANDARAAISHVSKGGTIEFGPSLDEKELKGNTNIKNTGSQSGTDVSGDVSLNDTIVDIETKGTPTFDGRAEIETDNVTIRGAAASDGGSVTLNMKVKLSNTTVTFKNNGVIQNGKVLAGDVDIKDSQIEIDLPPGTLDPGRKAGEKKTITGAKIKVTSLSGGSGGTGSSISLPSTTGGSGTTKTPTPTPSTTTPGTPLPPVAGPGRSALLQQIKNDTDLLSIYSALAGKEGIVPSDELLLRFVALKAMIKRHPNAVQTIINTITPGQITDPIKQIIEPIERTLEQENATLGQKLAQSISGTPPASGTPSTPGTATTDKSATGADMGADTTSDKQQPPTPKPGDTTTPAGSGGAPAPVSNATAIPFSAIRGQLVWPKYEAPAENKPPATYTYWVTWVAKVGGTQLTYNIPLMLALKQNLPPKEHGWFAEYTFASPAGTFTTEQGDIPIQFSDAGRGSYSTQLYTTKQSGK